MNTDALGRMKVWNWVFVINLAVPMFFGLPMQRDSGWAGLGLAVVLYWWAGRCACERHRLVGRSLIYGGAATGVSQLFPVVQLVAGIIGLAFTAKFVAEPGGWGLGRVDGQAPGMGFAGGFLATFFTGGLLIAVALVVGLFLSSVSDLLVKSPQTKPQPKGASKILYDAEIDGGGF